MSALLRTFLAACALFLVAPPPKAAAQISIGSSRSKTNGLASPLAPESLTVTVTSGIAIGFTLRSNASSNPGSGTTTVTTSWSSLKVSRTSVAVWAYFNSATSALVHQNPLNTADIPSAAAMIQVNGVGPFTALTNMSPFLGVASGLQLANILISPGNRTGTVTNTLAYNIDTTKVPQLPADIYIGTLNIQAQAIP